MRQWRMIQDCELRGEREMKQEITFFFACPYSYTIRESLVRKLVGIRINPDWQLTMHRLQRIGMQGTDSCLARLLFQTTIYHIWRERNAIKHQKPRTSTDNMRKLIYKAMKNMICSLKYKLNHKLERLLRRWFEFTL